MKVYLDLDGVVINFVQGVIDHLELDCKYDDITSWDSLRDIYGKPNFWDALDEKFWTGLDVYPWASKLILSLEQFEPILLTAPAYNSAGFRQAWIRKRLPVNFYLGRYIITPQKYHLAKNSDTILIDDSSRNCHRWAENGGQCIVFPQKWNGYTGVDNYGEFLRRWNANIY